MTIKKVNLVKRPKKQKVNINKMSSKKSKGGSKCNLNYLQKRGGSCKKEHFCPCKCGCPHCSQIMKGGQICVGQVLHGCLRREISQNNKRASTHNGSNKDYTLHSKYTRFAQNEGNVVRDLIKTNKRSDISVKRIQDGRMTGGSKRKKGGAKKGQYTKPSLKRVTNSTPEYAKKHATLAKGGTSGYKKSKNRVSRVGKISIKPKSVKKGGSSGYKKSKSRVSRINSKQVQPKKPVKKSSKFA
jgi:hypothetical protein